jgi:ABC-2 type transport system permease protein
MENFKTLQFLDRLKWLFEKLGVDYPMMRKILQVKLTMDQRRMPTVFSQQAKKKNGKEAEDDNRFMKSLWVYGLLGLFLIPFVLFGENYIFQMSIVFGIIMFVVMTTMISDFSTVLLDIRDSHILSTKPITKKTISAAKAVHISIYLFFLTVSITAGPMIAGLIKHGVLFFILFFIEMILLDLLIIVLTALSYLLILRYFDGEKLKDMINYVQIILSIGMAVGYQLVARSFELMDIEIMFEPSWWQFLVPPVWFAGSFETLLNSNSEPYFVIFSLLSLIVPIASFAVYIKLMPAFEENLQKLANNSGKYKVAEKKLDLFLAKIICPNKEERAIYRFAQNMMRNEREFRLNVYPSLGISLILPFLFIFNQFRENTFENITSGNGYLNIYFCLIFIPNAVIMLKYSGRYKGAWIFKIAPLKDLTPLLRGTLKAFIVKLFLPVFFVLSMLFTIIFGIRIIPDLAIVLINSIFFTVISTLLIKGSLPFSESFDAIQQYDGWKTLPYMLMIALFAGLHYVSGFSQNGRYIYLAVMLIVVIFSWKIVLKRAG